jgi:uncharacterized SAM-binding protein YcdF (DUF218 family)
MFFILSKTLGQMVLPSNLLILLGLLGLAAMLTPLRRAGARLAVVCFVLLALAGLFPFGAVLGHALESRFPPWDEARGAPDGVIVLGGGLLPELSRQFGEPIVSGDAGRIVAMVKLARAYPQARIVYTGGDASLLGDGAAEADFLYPLLDSFGVLRSRVILESRSRNTAENAAFTKELVKPKPGERWLLVTSAQHMPRAIGCFRAVGFPVEAYPVDWQTRTELRFAISRTFAGGLARADDAVHEWLGLFVYWLTGRTGALLPEPEPAGQNGREAEIHPN